MFSSIRTGVLLWFVVLLALASLASVLVVRQVLFHRLDQRIDRELVQETRELRALARGNDPETGEPFAGRVRRIFEVFLSRNIPSRSEAIVTFVDGEPFLRSRQVVSYRIDRDPELVGIWSTSTESRRGRAETPEGTLEYLAVPLRVEDRVRGVFVVAIFRDLERAETGTSVAVAGAAATGAVVLLFGTLLAWRLADRILKPVTEVQQTARSISESDLSRRIEITGTDEISALAQTFNEMLDRLEEAFRAQKGFIDDAGHELRTPITIVRGHLELLEDDPEERARTLRLVTDELDRMSRLVDDLLLLARSERPDFLRFSVVDVRLLTEEVYAKASAIAPRSWRLDEVGSGRIVADPQRLTQALVQLTQNAAQHTADGDEIGIGSQVSDGAARFWVRDTGPGVPAEDRDRIFERRWRASGRSDGVGLGLAIVRAIVRAHRGTVGVEGAPGEGATFALTVPTDRPPEEASAT